MKGVKQHGKHQSNPNPTIFGRPEVLRFEDAPRPTPGSGELLVRVHAASVNPFDWKARAGFSKDFIPLPRPSFLVGTCRAWWNQPDQV